MGVLHVKIDRVAKTATFSGDTFNAKEQIKSLGSANWLSSERIWRVSGFDRSADELVTLFPNAVITEGETAVGGTEIRSSGETPRENSAAKLPDSFSVRELSAQIRKTLARAFPAAIYVRGVLSSVKRDKRGYVFIDLAEEEQRDEVFNCVIWSDADRITKPLHDAGFELEPELQVMFEVQVSLSKRRGSISLEIISVVPGYTIAKLAAQREKTNERLRQEGIFDRNKTLRLPFLPKRLGILTSAGGTVIHDFRNSLDAANFGFELFWCSVGVQGADAKSELLQGIKRLERLELDAILIFRGGGSAADLAIFNEYEIAKAVCLSRVPVLSAIGHQEDQSSVQDVSFLALGVPKDIGRYFADIVIEHRQRVSEIINVLINRTSEITNSLNEKLISIARHVYVQAASGLNSRKEFCRRMAVELPRLCKRRIQEGVVDVQASARPIQSMSRQLCDHSWQRCVDTSRSLIHVVEVIWQRYADRVEYSMQLVNSAAPDVQLKRGFALIRRHSSGKFITRAEALSPNEEIEVQFYDAVRRAQISRK